MESVETNSDTQLCNNGNSSVTYSVRWLYSLTCFVVCLLCFCLFCVHGGIIFASIDILIHYFLSLDWYMAEPWRIYEQKAYWPMIHLFGVSWEVQQRKKICIVCTFYMQSTSSDILACSHHFFRHLAISRHLSCSPMIANCTKKQL